MSIWYDGGFVTNPTECFWSPSQETVISSQMTRFINFKMIGQLRIFLDYWDLHRWSINEIGEFWSCLSEFTNVKWQRLGEHRFSPPANDKIMGAQWFQGSLLNFAENMFAGMSE